MSYPRASTPAGLARFPTSPWTPGLPRNTTFSPARLSGSSDSASAVGWLGDAGTSAASPIWAGLIAIADQGRALEGGTPLTGYTQTLPALYSLPAADFHDILSGNNGYAAGPGYDLVTGLGTPVANLLVPALANYELPSQINDHHRAAVKRRRRRELRFERPRSTIRRATPVDGGTVTVALDKNPDGATLGGTSRSRSTTASRRSPT